MGEGLPDGRDVSVGAVAMVPDRKTGKLLEVEDPYPVDKWNMMFTGYA